MFKNQLKFYRKQIGLTQQQMAEKLCISQRAYGYYEDGKNEPGIETIKKLCIIFNISADELLEIETKEDRSKISINNSFNNAQNIHFKVNK